jgi:hypothetical protein
MAACISRTSAVLNSYVHVIWFIGESLKYLKAAIDPHITLQTEVRYDFRLFVKPQLVVQGYHITPLTDITELH